MYTPARNQYYSHVANGLNQGVGTDQLLIQGNGSYFIQQGVVPKMEHSLITSQGTSSQTAMTGSASTMFSGNTNSSTLEDDGHPGLCHGNKVSPVTIQWLLENYETAEGVSLPRSTLYNHYHYHCSENKLDPVNAASFGKLIRSVFLGLRTRRLGTRGNSKYHYYGIKVKPGSNLNQLSEDYTSWKQNGSSQKTFTSLKVEQYGHVGTGSNNSMLNYSNSLSPQVQHQEFLGDIANAIPDFPQIRFSSDFVLPEDCTLEDVETLRSIYREHCETFLDAVINLEFHTVESLWQEFWRSQDNNNGDECEEEKYLSNSKLFSLCKCRPVQYFIQHIDFHFYQNLVEVLMPDVLQPIPSSLTQSIRNFARSLESWLTQAMNGYPEELVCIKVTAVSAFAQTLRRYTSLNHLAQAARAVLQNSSQISQMLDDLNRVDFHNIRDQASWLCQCDDNVIQCLESDFKMTLRQQHSLEEWAVWLKTVLTKLLESFKGKPNFTNAARQFLLKWSFYNSMVIRDLTLRSAASFGSFHLIRLLYDEYMFYLTEHLVAVETGKTPIAVTGDKFKNPYNGYSQASGPYDGGLCLNIVGDKYLSESLLMNINEMNHHPEKMCE